MADSTATVGQVLLAEVRQHMQACHRKIQHCVDQLSDEQVWWRADERLNSIGNLLLHLEGNIHQRILAVVGGEPDRRDRGAEFAERRAIPKAELMARLDDTMSRVDPLLAALSDEQLLRAAPIPVDQRRHRRDGPLGHRTHAGPPRWPHAGNRGFHAVATWRALSISAGAAGGLKRPMGRFFGKACRRPAFGGLFPGPGSGWDFLRVAVRGIEF